MQHFASCAERDDTPRVGTEGLRDKDRHNCSQSLPARCLVIPHHLMQQGSFSSDPTDHMLDQPCHFRPPAARQYLEALLQVRVRWKHYDSLLGKGIGRETPGLSFDDDTSSTVVDRLEAYDHLPCDWAQHIKVSRSG